VLAEDEEACTHVLGTIHGCVKVALSKPALLCRAEARRAERRAAACAAAAAVGGCLPCSGCSGQ
jgi:hypothetical protein